MSFLSFLLMLLFTNLKFEIPILVIVSIITSFLLTQLLNKLYVIQNKAYLMFFTFLFVLLAHFLFYKRLEIGYNILPRSQTFIIYNTIILIPLTFGISKKA
jgi:hypothetical protein